ELVDLVDDLERELVPLQALDVVALEDQVPVGRGAAGRRWSWSWSGVGHDVPPVGGPCGPQATAVSLAASTRTAATSGRVNSTGGYSPTRSSARTFVPLSTTCESALCGQVFVEAMPLHARQKNA